MVRTSASQSSPALKTEIKINIDLTKVQEFPLKKSRPKAAFKSTLIVGLRGH